MADVPAPARVLVVGESFAPDNTPRANRWAFFSLGLERHGYRVDIVSRHFTATPLQDTRVAVASPARSGLLRRAVRRAFSIAVFEHHVFWALQRYLVLSARRQQLQDVDVVVAYALPLSGVVLGGALALRLRKPLVVEYGDPVDVNPARKPPWLERVANRWIMRHATRLIVTNQNYADFAARTYARPVDCLPPVASLPAPDADAGQRAASHLAQLGPGVPRVFYAGMFFEGIRSGATLLEALERRPDGPVFVHAGTPYARAAGATLYRSLGYIGQELVSHYLYWSDAVLYFSNDSAYQTPSKVVEVALMAPLVIAIGRSFSELERQLLAQTRTIIVENDADAIAQALGSLLDASAATPRSVEEYAQRVERLARHNAGVLDGLAGIVDACRAAGRAPR